MITYADIEEIYSLEKSRKNIGILQKIDEKFYSDFAGIYNSSGEHKEYIRKLGEGIYTERMQKILIHALRANMGNIKEPANMTKEEEEIYYKILDIIKTYENKFLFEKEKINNTDNKPDDEKISEVKIKFLDSCPGIVGDDLRRFGPFNDEDVVLITGPLAKILVNNGFAEFV
ncbi:MAG: hypothetical protein COV98_02600 [Candidatus Altarchaeum sp. CG12_big_fil_rev_8_21_14_0_65_33_22]|nr:MAG: hypothetical protein AUK59_01560 [Candidatus Altarchaeum sp. CG2_30_32_3053]PIN67506.1 MAG: hypothetical protein COV98_02600 [Candidatus Altarchaeum sp. CG12_big_fil_rev_8_21_14_0_65_33_22]PIV28604.1 MAG: hypothetical protein COS36_01645 [Candidatus Altarchaeum sp. CG03_land_8_20_14_0_80_32_618]PIZ29296.1 MAG: hypothetical protein COY41_06005 [Candidatus Altarchaeum sp. CG_4_10_14_0_8_um_filter_32_851]PJC14576.1 MAG: hypothetical protein CO063_02580 [Candidatus Altarchaeum sp. CG_4_9_14